MWNLTIQEATQIWFDLEMAQMLFGFASLSMKMLKFSYLAVFAYKATSQLLQDLCKSYVLLLILMSHIHKNSIDSFLHFNSTYKLLLFFVFWGVGFVHFCSLWKCPCQNSLCILALYPQEENGTTSTAKTDKGNIPRVIFSSVFHRYGSRGNNDWCSYFRKLQWC